MPQMFTRSFAKDQRVAVHFRRVHLYACSSTFLPPPFSPRPFSPHPFSCPFSPRPLVLPRAFSWSPFLSRPLFRRVHSRCVHFRWGWGWAWGCLSHSYALYLVCLCLSLFLCLCLSVCLCISLPDEILRYRILICYWLSCFVMLFWCPVFGRIAVLFCCFDVHAVFGRITVLLYCFDVQCYEQPFCKCWTPKQHNKTAEPKADKCPTSHFSPFNCCLSVDF